MGPGDGALVMAAIHITVGQVAATLALVGIAVAVSVWQRADLERDIGIAVIRFFIQLTAIGYVIDVIFEQDNLAFVFALLAAMVLFGAFTARSRARKVPHAFWPLLIALAVSGATALGLVLVLGVFDPEARYLVPIGRDGDRQRDDRRSGRAQPPRRRRGRLDQPDRSHARARRDLHTSHPPHSAAQPPLPG